MDDEDRTKVVLFGRDLLKIPCFRTAFLYSISSYIGVGLTAFLLTSKPRLSSHIGFTAFVVVTCGYYMDCRLKYAKSKMQIAQIQEMLQKAAVMEGTEGKSKSVPKLENV